MINWLSGILYSPQWALSSHKFPQLSLWIAEFQPTDNTLSHSFLMNYPVYTKICPIPEKNQTTSLAPIVITCKFECMQASKIHFCTENPISGGGIWPSQICHNLKCISKYVHNLTHVICAYANIYKFMRKQTFRVVASAEQLATTHHGASPSTKNQSEVLNSHSHSGKEHIFICKWNKNLHTMTLPTSFLKEFELVKIQRAE